MMESMWEDAWREAEAEVRANFARAKAAPEGPRFLENVERRATLILQRAVRELEQSLEPLRDLGEVEDPRPKRAEEKWPFSGRFRRRADSV